MRETVDVRTVGWGTDCEFQKVVDDSYQDDSGQVVSDYKWESQLHCEMVAVNDKMDYCKTCGKNLVYP